MGNIVLWSNVESAIGLIAGSLPSLRRLILAHAKKASSSTGESNKVHHHSGDANTPVGLVTFGGTPLAGGRRRHAQENGSVPQPDGPRPHGRDGARKRRRRLAAPPRRLVRQGEHPRHPRRLHVRGRADAVANAALAHHTAQVAAVVARSSFVASLFSPCRLQRV